jgi:hypothetical protein
MSRLSLTPGFSQVSVEQNGSSRFSGFPQVKNR